MSYALPRKEHATSGRLWIAMCTSLVILWTEGGKRRPGCGHRRGRALPAGHRRLWRTPSTCGRRQARIVQKPPTITLRFVTHRNNRRTHRPLAERKPGQAGFGWLGSPALAGSVRRPWLARFAGLGWLGSPALAGSVRRPWLARFAGLGWLARRAGFASWLGLGHLGGGMHRVAGVTGAPAYWRRHCPLSDPECNFDCHERDTLLK